MAVLLSRSPSGLFNTWSTIKEFRSCLIFVRTLVSMLQPLEEVLLPQHGNIYLNTPLYLGLRQNSDSTGRRGVAPQSPVQG